MPSQNPNDVSHPFFIFCFKIKHTTFYSLLLLHKLNILPMFRFSHSLRAYYTPPKNIYIRDVLHVIGGANMKTTKQTGGATSHPGTETHVPENVVGNANATKTPFGNVAVWQKVWKQAKEQLTEKIKETKVMSIEEAVRIVNGLNPPRTVTAEDVKWHLPIETSSVIIKYAKTMLVDGVAREGVLYAVQRSAETEIRTQIDEWIKQYGKDAVVSELKKYI